MAFGLWCVLIAVWHVPALYDAALTSQALHDLEHASFMVAGFLVWYQLLDPTGHGLRRSGRLGLVVALFAAGQILTMVLVFSFEPLYPAYAAEPVKRGCQGASTSCVKPGSVRSCDVLMHPPAAPLRSRVGGRRSRALGLRPMTS